MSCCVSLSRVAIVMQSLYNHEQRSSPLLFTPFGACLQGIDKNIKEISCFLSVYAECSLFHYSNIFIKHISRTIVEKLGCFAMYSLTRARMLNINFLISSIL